jgi:hypothetical protein
LVLDSLQEKLRKALSVFDETGSKSNLSIEFTREDIADGLGFTNRGQFNRFLKTGSIRTLPRVVSSRIDRFCRIVENNGYVSSKRYFEKQVTRFIQRAKGRNVIAAYADKTPHEIISRLSEMQNLIVPLVWQEQKGGTPTWECPTFRLFEFSYQQFLQNAEPIDIIDAKAIWIIVLTQCGELAQAEVSNAEYLELVEASTPSLDESLDWMRLHLRYYQNEMVIRIYLGTAPEIVQNLSDEFLSEIKSVDVYPSRDHFLSVWAHNSIGNLKKLSNIKRLPQVRKIIHEAFNEIKSPEELAQFLADLREDRDLDFLEEVGEFDEIISEFQRERENQ